ncbi:MAG: hypothetical protein ACRD4B_04285 [Acidobacteriota bacterium]
MKIRGFQDTIAWYDQNAKTYAKRSLIHAQIDVIDRFIALLPRNPAILDVGCGSGRDAHIFSQGEQR